MTVTVRWWNGLKTLSILLLFFMYRDVRRCCKKNVSECHQPFRETCVLYWKWLTEEGKAAVVWHLLNLHIETACYWKVCYRPFICTEPTSLYTDSVGSLVTDRKSAHWDSYQWKLFKACAGACTVSHCSGLFPWQPLPPSTCGCWQPSERSPQSLKYHWQGQHPAGGKPLKRHVHLQRCGARKTPSFFCEGEVE